MPTFNVQSMHNTTSDLTESSTTSKTQITRMTMTTSSLTSGTYRLGWHYNWKTSKSNRPVSFVILLNGVTELHREDTYSTKQTIHSCGFSNVILGNGAHTIELQYCINGKNNTDYVKILSSEMELWRVL
jgi:hypothetical protein